MNPVKTYTITLDNIALIGEDGKPRRIDGSGHEELEKRFAGFEDGLAEAIVSAGFQNSKSKRAFNNGATTQAIYHSHEPPAMIIAEIYYLNDGSKVWGIPNIADLRLHELGKADSMSGAFEKIYSLLSKKYDGLLKAEKFRLPDAR